MLTILSSAVTNQRQSLQLSNQLLVFYHVICVSNLCSLLVRENIGALCLLYLLLVFLDQQPLFKLADLLEARPHFLSAFDQLFSLLKFKTLNNDFVQFAQVLRLTFEWVQISLEFLHGLVIGHPHLLQLLFCQRQVARNHHFELSDVEAAEVALSDLVEGLLEN